MKKKTAEEDPLDREIDFSNARPNPYFVAAVGAKYIRVIEKDLADLFPDNAAVNAALRSVAEVAARIPAQPQKISARRVAAPAAPAKKKIRT
jgi:hypothetical protein